ncbi:hypothetical protein [uncultured Ruminococcus sp.]|uniref:hypothetical protein n=1 Tax=uncultured Ruminococcus sp. TaxID=165186 RepID=UPI0025ECBB9E|nr:hypothetical protein [uncultured Ruminococcus sp.]
MTKIFAICVLSIMGVVFVFGIAGYFIFLSRVKTKKTAIKLKRHLKKNAAWWACCWAAWLVVGFLEWNGARKMNDNYHMMCYGLLLLALLLLTILLLLDFFIGKYAYITSQRVYFPDNFGLARQKKKIMYKVSGETLSLWFNNSIMPKKFTIIEKHDELVKLLKDNYKLNKSI